MDTTRSALFTSSDQIVFGRRVKVKGRKESSEVEEEPS
jgi:hypothetical protein